MDSEFPGATLTFADANPGAFFAFRFGDYIAFGLKIAVPPDAPAQIAVLHRGHPTETHPPYLMGSRAGIPNIIHRLPVTLVCRWGSIDQLRNGVPNPVPGQTVVTPDRHLIGLRVGDDDDTAMVDLATGRLEYNLMGPATIFSSWSLALKGGDTTETEIVYSYAVPKDE
jgi:hypothetical protein